MAEISSTLWAEGRQDFVICVPLRVRALRVSRRRGVFGLSEAVGLIVVGRCVQPTSLSLSLFSLPRPLPVGASRFCWSRLAAPGLLPPGRRIRGTHQLARVQT